MRDLRLLHNIGQILKADEGEEGEQAAEIDAGQSRGVERRQAGYRRGDRKVGVNAGED